MARPRRNAVYVPNDGYSRIRVATRGADLALHEENRRAARNGRPLPHRITYRTLATVAGKQVERYKGTDFERACTVADDWHVQIDRPNPGRLTTSSTFADVLAVVLTPEAKPNWGRKQMDRAKGFARNHLDGLAKKRNSTLTAVHFNRKLTELADEGYAPDTIQGIHDLMKTAVRYAARNGAQFGGIDIAADITMPTKKLAELNGGVLPKVGAVRPIEKSKQATARQVAELLDAVRVLSGDTPAELLELIDDTGLRWGEGIGLGPHQWDPVRQGFLIDRQLAEYDKGWDFTLPKHGKIRFVVVSPHLVPMVTRRVKAALETQGQKFASGRAKNPHCLLFTGPQGGWFRRGNFNKRILKPAAQLTRLRAADQGDPTIGWPVGLAIHSLRHRWVMKTYVALSNAYQDGAQALLDLSRMAGHHSPAYTAKKYLAADDDYAQRVRDALNAIGER